MGTITHLIRRVKVGSRTAFAGLVGRCYPTAVLRARRRLRGAAGVHDAEDVAVRTFWELWREVTTARPLGKSVVDTASLLRALALLTRQQAVRVRRYDSRLCRDARRTAPAPGGDGVGGTPKASMDPWPAFYAALESRELVEVLIDRLPSDNLKVLARLLQAGLSQAEAARECGCSVRTVERQFAQIRAIWQPHVEVLGEQPAE